MVVDERDIETGTVRITWTPDKTLHDWHMVDLSISDGVARDNQGWAIQVLLGDEPPGNQAPYFTTNGSRDARSNVLYEYDADAEDLDRHLRGREVMERPAHERSQPPERAEAAQAQPGRSHPALQRVEVRLTAGREAIHGVRHGLSEHLTDLAHLAGLELEVP